jgi:hypothetical protein
MKKLARLPESDKEMKTHYVSAALSCFLMRLSQDIAREQFFTILDLILFVRYST